MLHFDLDVIGIRAPREKPTSGSGPQVDMNPSLYFQNRLGIIMVPSAGPECGWVVGGRAFFVLSSYFKVILAALS